MRRRCNNPNHEFYRDYGGRGITVCPEWDSYETFLFDMGRCPKGRTLDRKDNDGGYSKANCRWATRREQQANRRGAHWIEYKGERKVLAEWARYFGRASLFRYLKKYGEQGAIAHLLGESK